MSTGYGANVQDAYKAQLRAAGRKALEDFRRQRGARGSSAGVGGAGVEMKTFRVVQTQAAAAVAPSLAARVGAQAPDEARALASQLASTTLGPLPPGGVSPPHTAPAAEQALGPGTVTGSPGPGSAAAASSAAPGPSSSLQQEPEPPSASTGMHSSPLGPLGSPGAAAAQELPPGSGPGPSHASPRPREAGAREEEGPPDAPSTSGAGGGAGDQALVDMLLGQVAALMRDKAALQADNTSLRQQVEQLTELVGWLSIERGGGGEGDDGGGGGEGDMGPSGEVPGLEDYAYGAVGDEGDGEGWSFGPRAASLGGALGTGQAGEAVQEGLGLPGSPDGVAEVQTMGSTGRGKGAAQGECAAGGGVAYATM